MREAQILIFSLVLGSVGHLATDIYLPSLPNLTEYFGTSTALVQLTLTAYMLSYCITPIFMGPLSDHIGRKKPILLGLVIGLFATLCCIFANNIQMLILARFLQGIGLGMVATASRAILPDNFTGSKLAKNFTYATMFMPVVLAIGPPLGGIIQDHSSWQTVFGFLMAHTVILIFIVKLFFKDNFKSHQNFTSSKYSKAQDFSNSENPNSQGFTNSKNSKNSNPKVQLQILQSYKLLLSNESYIRYSLCSVFLFMGITSYIAVNPFLFQSVYGLTPTQNGLVAIILFVGTFISGFINSRLVTIFKGKNLLYLANGLIIFSGLLLFILPSFTEVTFLTFIFFVFPFFLSVPIVFSITGSLALSNVKGNFGAATALLSTFQYLGGALSSFLISFADQTSVKPLAISYLLLGLLFFITLFSERSKKKVLEEVNAVGEEES